MASDRLEKLMGEVEVLSSSYAQVTSALSDQITAFEKRLRALDGKAQATVKTEDGWKLIFQRARGSWGLWIGYASADILVLSSAPVKAKLQGVKLLEPLLLEMRRIQSERYGEAVKAQAIIAPLLGALLPKDEKEGE